MIAVAEATGNSAMHAYRDTDGGEMQVGVRAEGADVLITVTDQGCGPGSNLASTGKSIGFPMMAVLADSLTVRGDPDTGTEITMTFARGPGVTH